jgi:RNA polymerase sigma factor (sigma-70 family)
MNASKRSDIMDETATRTLDGEALAGIERSLHGRLRAHHISDSFFDRYGEDAVQKGLVEYLRAKADGVEVREPRAFVLQAAFRRAIDELRREARRADGDALEQVLESGRWSAPPAEDEAIANIEAGRLQESIDSLSLEEQRILALHYFEEVGQRRAAELLYMSERTFRRRLKRAQAHLARLLGAPAPEPDTHRGLEIGLAAWAGLGGGPMIASGAAGHLVGALESARAGAVRLLERLRGPGARLAASEAPERIGAIAGGPAGKVVGGCAGAAVVCVLSGVIGPGLELGSGHGAAQPQDRPHRIAESGLRRPLRPIIVEPKTHPHVPVHSQPAGEESAGPSTTPVEPAPRHQHGTRPKPKKAEKKLPAPPSESEETEEQFGGVVEAGSEAEAEAEAGTSISSGESSALQEPAPNRSAAPVESDHAASEERQVEEQFRGPLAP